LEASLELPEVWQITLTLQVNWQIKKGPVDKDDHPDLSAGFTRSVTSSLPTIGFGDLLGAGNLTRLNAKRGGKRAHGACGRRGASGFEASDRQSVESRTLGKLGLSQKVREAQAAKSVGERQNRLRGTMIV